MKRCSKCSVVKPESDFHLKLGRPRSACKDCCAQYRKVYYQKNRDRYIYQAAVAKQRYREEYYVWLSSQKCVDCGNDDPRVLEQDHQDDKVYAISKKVGWVPLRTLLPELEKCEVVCCNCHRIRTITRGGWQKALFSHIVD